LKGEEAGGRRKVRGPLGAFLEGSGLRKEGRRHPGQAERKGIRERGEKEGT